jgi:FKBP-type peptidyl-prolyl cis-trans isomerase
MKYLLIALAGLSAFSTFAADKPELKDDKAKASYAVGLNIGKNWKNQSIDLDVDTVTRGIRDALAEKDGLTDTEVKEILTKFQTDLRGKAEAKRKEDLVKNQKAGAEFLAANEKKPGVKKTASGLQYKSIKEGTGPVPTTNDTVIVHYKGTLIDGKEFDSSYKRNEPATFPVTGVIKGWTEALTHMKVGSKWELYIPSELAYGERGRGAQIGPNSTLVFEVELVGIKPPEAKPPTPEPITSDIIKVPSAEELKKGAKIEVIKPGSTITNK